MLSPNLASVWGYLCSLKKSFLVGICDRDMTNPGIMHVTNIYSNVIWVMPAEVAYHHMHTL